MDLYNAKTPGAEIGGNGFTDAYTELKGDNASGSLYTGKCITTGGAVAYTPTMTAGSNGLGNYNTGATYTMDFESDAATLTEIEAYGTSTTETWGLSICASLCSNVLDYLHDGTTNLPTSVGTWGTGECLGFMLDINTATAPVCTSYHTAIPTKNATETGDSGVESCYERDLSKLAYDYVTAIAGVNTAAEGGADDWDYMNVGLTNWDTAYENLVDARAELDIAQYYYTQLNTA